MKNFLAAILLATVAAAADADPRPRQVRMMCGSAEDVQMTMEKYGETLVLASMAPNKESVNMLWVNFEKQTSSWFIHDLGTNEYCMAGVGDQIMLPEDSPLKEVLGTKIKYY